MFMAVLVECAVAVVAALGNANKVTVTGLVVVLSDGEVVSPTEVDAAVLASEAEAAMLVESAGAVLGKANKVIGLDVEAGDESVVSTMGPPAAAEAFSDDAF
mmetsp:Transcript_40358/g.88247  ORF Transcript_40358/g.88247 Transcript_40358/m.88247 type:complete len:102 (-) Transcript_40358:108-413(-)